jgi:F-type H+-transporting ATPase subunit b
MTENTRNRLTAIAVALPAFMSAKAFAAGASEPGLPQLDIATWPSQLFWLVVLFGAGYLVMAKIVTPRIGAVLEERRQTVDGDLEKARAASTDAAKIRADYESDLEKARIEAAEFAKQAAMEATKKAEAADAKIAKKLADKVGAAEAKTSAMANLNDVAAEAAMAAVASLAGIKTSSAQARKTASSIATKLAKQETN